MMATIIAKTIAERPGYQPGAEYTLSVSGDAFLTSGEIKAGLDQGRAMHREAFHAIEDIERNGIRYANHDLDVLSRAYRLAAGA